MSANLTPSFAGSSTEVAPLGVAAPVPYRPAVASAPAAVPPAIPVEAQIRRVLSAVSRHKWLIGILGVLGAAGGFGATTMVDPTYVVQSSILINPDLRGDRGPISDNQVLETQGWIDLLRTNAIADAVVMKLALYVEPERARDSVVLRGFQIKPGATRFVPGRYTLEVKNGRYTLRDKLGFVTENGTAGDSIGHTAGFAWVPSRAALGRERTMEFRVRQPREASVSTIRRLQVGLAKGSNLIFVQLTGTAQQKPAETLNAWNERFIEIATQLKTSRTDQALKALTEQRAAAEQRLMAADRAYEEFRVATIALPSDALAIQMGPGGVAAVRNDPVMDNYTTSKYQLEALRRDRVRLESVSRTLTADSIPVEALLNVNVVNSDPITAPLRSSLGELAQIDGSVRQLRRTLQDRTPPLAGLLEQRRVLTSQQVPRQLAAVLAQLRQREAQYGSVVTQTTGELQDIPRRNNQLESLRRERDAAGSLFAMLNARYSESQLADKSATPDVRILDTAVLPSEASQNTPTRLIALGLVGGLGLGLGFAVLRDRLDRRFRYPGQVTHDLGLQILGVIPEVDQNRKQTPEQVAQIVEAFRTVRMNVRYACAPSPRVLLTVTSPGAGDGKSLIASNLALSLAEGGWRTVIIDGDLRRGQLNATFNVAEGPGLVEYLDGTMLLGEVLQPTAHDNLQMIATGARHARGPELLGTPRMQQLVASLAAEYDAVIVDAPPLGAGTDAYALAAATTNVVLVLRQESTDVKMADAKLQTLDTLPVQVIGAVLNEVRANAGMYQYLAYDPDYILVEGTPEEPAGERPQLVGQ